MKIKEIASLLFTIFVVIACIIYLGSNQNLLSSLSTISPTYLLLIVVLQIGSVILNIVINQIIFRMRSKISLNDCFSSTVHAALINMFLPFKAGTTFQAIFLKRKYNLSLLWYAGTFYAVSIMLLVFVSLLGILSLSYLYLSLRITSLPLYIIFLGFLIFGLFIHGIYKLLLIASNKLTNPLFVKVVHMIGEINRGLMILFDEKKTFFSLILLVVLNVLCLLVITFLEFHAFNVNISLPKIMIFFSLSVFSLLINLTPGSIGIKEFIQYVFSSVLNITKEHIILIAIVDRTLLFLALASLSTLPLFSGIYTLLNKNAHKN